MTDRETFIQDFYEQFGSLPDEETIQINLGRNYYQERQPDFRQQRTRNYHNDGADELLAEIREITVGIANNARVAYRNRRQIIEARPYVSEFGYMTLIFLTKASLYFLLRDSYAHGMDLSSI